MKKYLYEAVLTPNELGGYDARFPELDIITFGDDLADAAFMAQDLLATAISAELKEGNEVPQVGKFGHRCPKGGTLMGIATYAEAADLLDETMTAQEAADLLGVTRARIYAMVKEGLIRSMKSGSARLVSAQDVMDRFNNPREAGRPKKADTVAMAS